MSQRNKLYDKLTEQQKGMIHEISLGQHQHGGKEEDEGIYTNILL